MACKHSIEAGKQSKAIEQPRFCSLDFVALGDFNGDKDPGPDGFSIVFLGFC